MDAKLILGILNMIQAGFTALINRGFNKDRIQTMLDAAVGGDLTSDQVQAELDTVQAELDATAKLIEDKLG